MATPCSCSMTDHQLYLGLGSNLGDGEANIRRAYRQIEKLIGTIVGQSAFFVSEPWGYESSHRFVNSVVRVATRLSPRDVLCATQQIEHRMGRTQKSEHATVDGRWTLVKTHDRIIDIDILLYDDIHIDEPDLKIPHPLMQQRPFVMIPLAEVLPSGSPA